MAICLIGIRRTSYLAVLHSGIEIPVAHEDSPGMGQDTAISMHDFSCVS